MDTPVPSAARRVALAGALLVPLLVDPFGADTLVLKRLALGLLGLAVLGLEALELLVRRRPVLAPAPVEVVLAGLALWAAVSLSWATNPYVGLVEVGGFVGVLGVARGLRAAIPDANRAWRWIGLVVVVGSVGLVVDAVAIQRLADDLDPSRLKHASWVFVHNNMAAAYAAMLAPLAMAGALEARGWARRLAWAAPVVAGLAYLVLLKSRAGILAVLLGLGLVTLMMTLRGVLSNLRPSRRGSAWLVLVMVVVAALLPTSERVRALAKDGFYRAVNVLDELGVADLGDAMFRPQLFRKTIDMVEEAPWRGVGVGNFGVVYPRYEPLRAVKPHAHNDALHALAELGLPGLLLLLGSLGAILLALVHGLGAGRRGLGFGLVAGLSGAWLVFVVCGLFEVPFVLGATGVNLAVVAGLAARVGEPVDRPRRTLAVGRPLALLVLAGVVALAALLARRLPASALLTRARSLAAAGDVEAATAAGERLAGLGTGSFVPERLLSGLALRRGEPERALVHVRAARALWPFNVELMEDEGRILLVLGRTDEAVARYQQAVAASPSRPEALFRLVGALSGAGRHGEAIDLLEPQVQAHPTISLEAVVVLAREWDRRADLLSGDAQVAGLVAARHFYALVLQDGSAQLAASVAEEFKHVTHRLQSLPGAPDAWWRLYDRFRAEGGWRLPNTALWTSMDADGVRLFPGWDETAGPPLPREMR